MSYPTKIHQEHPVKGWIAEEKVCETCGEKFVGWACHNHCPDCPRSKRRRKPPEERHCESCGEAFMLGLNGERGHENRKFCNSFREKGRKGRKAEPRKCKWCGNMFQPRRQRNETKLCSRKCQGYWINAEGLGPKHDDEKLLKRIITAIQTTPHRMSQEMLIEATGITRKTLEARNWTMEFLYEKAGQEYGPPLLDSYSEDRAFAALQSLFPEEEIVTQARFPDLISEKGHKLAVDFYICSRNLIVEVDGPQHDDSRGGFFPIERTRANDHARDRFAEEKGVILLRLPHSANISAIEEKVREVLENPPPGYTICKGPAPLPPSEPKPKTDAPHPLEIPLHDAYCRGCHARPSFKNSNTYLCKSCWESWKAVRRKAQKLDANAVEAFREELVEFIRDRGRYVWHPEVYIHLRPVAIGELKCHGIKVTKICRELGFFAPPDDCEVIRYVERVKGKRQ